MGDTKTGKSVRVLSDEVKKILKAQSRTGSAYVFPNPSDLREPVRGLDWAWVGIRNRAQLPDLRIHDLRHAFASFAVAQGVPIYTVGGLLGHTHHASTTRYAHHHDDPLRTAANEVANPIGVALKIGEDQELRYRPANEVGPLDPDTTTNLPPGTAQQ